MTSRPDSTHCTRRALLAAGIAAALASRLGQAAEGAVARLAAAETASGGRLGVYAFDTGSGRSIGLNEHDRFAMCSTFKLLLAAAILDRVDHDGIRLDQQIRFGPADMVSHAPATSKHVGRGFMTVEELCAAAVELSDNPAANLLLAQIGGPAGLTRYLRSIGDEVTRLDRNELALNSNLRGDPRDTTTPYAMAHSVAGLVTGDVLSAAAREKLQSWLRASPTGARRIRAGIPRSWTAGDKTGTGANGAVNDVAVLWPPGRAPIVVAVYMSESSRPVAELEPLHAESAQAISTFLST